MKEMTVTGGSTAICECCYPKAVQIPWYIDSYGYVRGYVKVGFRNYTKPSLHSMVASWHGMDLSQEIDHKNRNQLDNRCENLRPASKTQNQWNCKPRSHNKSGYKGVHLSDKKKKKWRANIVINGKQKFLGYFEKPEDAARAYDAVARQVQGEFFTPQI